MVTVNTFRSCRPAWQDMDRKVCPTTISFHSMPSDILFGMQ